MPTFEQLQAMGAVPVDAPSPGGGMTLEQLQKAGAVPAEGPSGREAFVRGGLQGASLGFGDEASALADTGVSKLAGLGDRALGLFGVSPHFGRGVQRLSEAGGGAGPQLPLDNPDLTYSQRRDAYRARNEAAEEAHPNLYTGGELVGGLAPLPFAAPAGEIKGLLGAVKTSAKMGAKIGAAAGLGSSKADLTEGDVGGAALDTLKGGALGGLVGGAVGAGGEAVRRVTSGGTDRIRQWVLKDIVGETRGASTKTAKLNLARDAEDVADVVTGDRKLETALRQASGHKDVGLLENAAAATQEALDKASKPRPQLYDGLNKELGGGVRAGDYVQHLKDAAEELEATGNGKDRGIAAHLRKRVNIIETSRDWGYQPTLDPKTQQIVENLEKGRTLALARGQPADQIDTAIQNFKAEGKPAFNPDTIVPAEKVRANVTDLQNDAYEAEGGLNGTPRFNRAREVASHAEDFLSDLKAKAAATNPDLIKALDEHDRQVSALLRVKNVLEQRLNHAKQESLGATGEGLFGRVIHAAAHPRAGVTREAIAAGAKGVIATGRAIDRGARAIDESPYASMVLDGLRRGLTLAAATEAAQAAGRAGAE